MPQLQEHITAHLSPPEKVDSTFWYLQKEESPVIWKASNYNFPVLEKEAVLPPLPFQSKPDNSNFPLFYIYLAITMIWAMFYRNNYKTLQHISQSFFSNTVFSQVINERKSINGFVSIGMFLLGLTVISIFSYQFILSFSLVRETELFNPSKSYIFLLLIFLISALFFKSLIIWFLSWVFDQPKTFTGYLSLNVNSIQILGIILLPLSISFTFGHHLNPLWIVGIGAILITLIFLYRLTRTFFLGVKETNSHVFHIILYICALEILPLFVLSRLLLGD